MMGESMQGAAGGSGRGGGGGGPSGSSGRSSGGPSRKTWLKVPRMFRVRTASSGRPRARDTTEQSIHSDSESDLTSFLQEEMCRSYDGTTKKFSLPVPITPVESSSDSVSGFGSYACRSEEASNASHQSEGPEPTPPSVPISPEPSTATNAGSEFGDDEEDGDSKRQGSVKTVVRFKFDDTLPMPTTHGRKSPGEGKRGKKKKQPTRAALTHKTATIKTAGSGRCRICEQFIYFWGLECTQCNLTVHKRCFKYVLVTCPGKPLPPYRKQTPASMFLGSPSGGLSATPSSSTGPSTSAASLAAAASSTPHRAPPLKAIGFNLSAQHEEVPIILLKLVSEIEKRGLTSKGIYRCPGSASRVDKLLRNFEIAAELVDISEIPPNDLATTLKLFLRNLSIPIIPYEFYESFVAIGRVYHAKRTQEDMDSHKDQIVFGYKKASLKLPRNHYHTLEFIVQHLRKVADEKENQMTAMSLGIVFAPNLFRKSEDEDPRNTLKDAAAQARTVELLIKYSIDIFGESSRATSLSSLDVFNLPLPAPSPASPASPATPKARVRSPALRFLTSRSGSLQSEKSLASSHQGTPSSSLLALNKDTGSRGSSRVDIPSAVRGESSGSMTPSTSRAESRDNNGDRRTSEPRRFAAEHQALTTVKTAAKVTFSDPRL